MLLSLLLVLARLQLLMAVSVAAQLLPAAASFVLLRGGVMTLLLLLLPMPLLGVWWWVLAPGEAPTPAAPAAAGDLFSLLARRLPAAPALVGVRPSPLRLRAAAPASEAVGAAALLLLPA